MGVFQRFVVPFATNIQRNVGVNPPKKQANARNILVSISFSLLFPSLLLVRVLVCSPVLMEE
jgi:hypothetical protein